MGKIYLSDVAYSKIKELIIKGEINGSISEHELANKLGMSRTPIREALQRLSNEEFLEIVANKGIFVKEVSIKETNDLMDLRLAIEIFSIERIDSKITDEDIHNLEQLVEQQLLVEEQKDIYTFLKLDIEYHEYFLKIFGNNHFIKVFHNISNRLYLHGVNVGKRGLTDAKSIEDHQKINASLKDKDFELAKSLLEKHILRGKANYLNQ